MTEVDQMSDQGVIAFAVLSDHGTDDIMAVVELAQPQNGPTSFNIQPVSNLD